MSTKKGKLIYLDETLIDKYTEFVMRAKKETSYQGMNFSRMCILGSEFVQHYYNMLSDDEKKEITDVEKFNMALRKKAGIKSNQ